MLKDNPDVDGNQKKIRDDREYLISSLKELTEEVKELNGSGQGQGRNDRVDFQSIQSKGGSVQFNFECLGGLRLII